MTIEEVTELTGRTFDFVVKNMDGSLAFCVPIPGANLLYGTDDDGNLVIPGPLEVWDEAWREYIAGFDRTKEYRTAAKAGKTTALPEPIDGNHIMPIITFPEYQYATSFNQASGAHLELLQAGVADKLDFRDGQLYFNNMESSRVNLVRMSTREGIADIDLQTLRILYGIILYNIAPHVQEMIEKDILGYEVTLYVPDLLKMMGVSKSDINEKSVEHIVAKISSYHNILGIMQNHSTRLPSQYPVVVYHGYDQETNTVRFASPYIGAVIKRIFGASIRKDKRGNPKVKKNGQLLMRPSHSYLIKADIAKARNKRAAEIVNVVVVVIERAGSNPRKPPHIKASTIIDRIPDLKIALDAASPSNKNLILKRAFSSAWKYLPKYTRLQEKYKNIKLPKPSDVPTMTNLDMTFEFPHEGKR